MEELLKQMVTEVSTVCKVGAQWVQADTEFPYATYAYQSSTSKNIDEVELTFDIWDKSKSIQQVEDIANEIREKLDRHKFTTEIGDFFAVAYHGSQSLITEDNPDTKRIRTIFSVRKYQI